MLLSKGVSFLVAVCAFFRDTIRASDAGYLTGVSMGATSHHDQTRSPWTSPSKSFNSILRKHWFVLKTLGATPVRKFFLSTIPTAPALWKRWHNRAWRTPVPISVCVSSCKLIKLWLPDSESRHGGFFCRGLTVALLLLVVASPFPTDSPKVVACRGCTFFAITSSTVVVGLLLCRRL